MSVPRELRPPVAARAWRITAALVALSFLALIPGALALAGLLLALAALNLVFFRNPRRMIPPGEDRVLSPGDGRVVEVSKLDPSDDFVGPGWRIAIFLSILDVHVQRAPLSARVVAVRRGGTGFRAAFRSSASEHNVRVRMDLEAPGGVRLAVAQITGLVARRIVCHAREGETLERGEPYGLICYGSRLELFLSERSRIGVRRGDRVRGGETVVAEVRA